MLRLTPLRMLAATLVVLGAIVVANLSAPTTNIKTAVAIAAAVVVAALLVAAGGRTLDERWGARRRRARHRMRNMLYSVAKHATVWDGRRSAMYVAFMPPPFQVSITDVADPVLPAAIPMDMLRDYLTQGDIELPEISVLQHGYRRYMRSAYNDAYEAMVGDTPVATSVSTAIEVPIDLARSAASINARNINDSIPSALGATTRLVASRLSRALNVAGYEARMMSPAEVKWFHASVHSWVNDGLKNESRTYLGGKTPSVVCRPAEWAPRAAEKWWQVPADRMAAAFTIGREGPFGTQPITGSLAFSYPDARDFPDTSYYLRRVTGGQGDALTTIMPLATSQVAAHRNDIELDRDQDYPIDIPGTGLGLYLGAGIDGGRVFINLQTGGEVMYVHGPAELIASLIARASAVGARVGVHLSDTGWARLAHAVNPSLISVQPSQRCAVEIYQERPPETIRDTTTVLVWCPQRLPSHEMVYSMVMEPDGVTTVSTPTGQVQFIFAPTADESALISGQRGAAALV